MSNYGSQRNLGSSQRGMSMSNRGSSRGVSSRAWTSSMNSNGGESVVYKYKVVLLGDEGCGKTSIITRLMKDEYTKEHNATVGVDFISKTMVVDERFVRLHLWDTAGKERFRSSIPTYVKDAQMIVIVYDVSDRKTWDNISNWLELIKSVRKNDFDDVVVCLVGNKCDARSHQTQVSSLEGHERATENDWIFIECSAKADYNIRRLFQKLADKLPSGIGDTSIRDISTRSAAHSRRRNYL